MKVLCIFQSPPHGKSSGREGLDATLAISSFCEDIGVIFIRDGVFQLKKDQQPSEILNRDYSKTFKLFSLYDISKVYVLDDSLKDNSLKVEDLILNVEVIDYAKLISLLNDSQIKLVF